jgi:hypothetical protein
MADPFDAAAWIDRWLAAYPFATQPREAADDLAAAVASLPKKQQVAIHEQAVARLPALRRDTADPHHFSKGSALYSLACRLYKEKLPRALEDVLSLLRSAKHDCGHGEDVKPPFETAVAWARAHGVSREWLAAVRTYDDALAGLSTVKANDVKTKAAIVLLLDESSPPKAGCGSERFRLGLRAVVPEERLAWERLVLFMGTAMGGKIPKDLEPQAENVVAFLGAEQVVARLDEWLPDPRRDGACRIDTADSHLLKNLVWLLVVLARDTARAALADPLVERLTRVEFAPADRAKKVAFACAVYFEARPPEVAAAPLDRIVAWLESLEPAQFDSSAIRKLVADYRARSAGR